MTDGILVVEDDAALRELLTEELEDSGYPTAAVASAEQALAALQQEHRYRLIISDVRLPGACDGMALLERVRAHDHGIGVIIITAFGTIEQAVDALKLGADDFLTKPLDIRELVPAARRVLEKRALEQLYSTSDEGTISFHGMLARSPAMKRIFQRTPRLARSDAPLLILGESGTGKELLAHAFHAESRRTGAFVAINCASVSPELLESEFFGHVRGAFTGAETARQGLFRQAEGGTLFLDEIGEMSLDLQARLLRVLQDGTIRPVGADREHRVDVRIVAATNRDLEKAVAARQFREDLFYRLEALSLELPPLRDREGDRELLAKRLIEKHAATLAVPIDRVDPLAISAIIHHDYPGNVRELENAVIRAVTLAEDGVLSHDNLPARMREQASMPPAPDEGEASTADEWPSLEKMEQRYIRKVLQATGGNKRRTAEILGIARKTLYRRLEEQ